MHSIIATRSAKNVPNYKFNNYVIETVFFVYIISLTVFFVMKNDLCLAIFGEYEMPILLCLSLTAVRKHECLAHDT